MQTIKPPLVSHVQNGDVEAMLAALHRTSFVLPLITSRPTRGSEYASGHKMSSSVSLALACDKPLIISEALVEGYARQGLDLSKQVIHPHGANGLFAGFLSSIRDAVRKYDNASSYGSSVAQLQQQKRQHQRATFSQLRRMHVPIVCTPWREHVL